MATTGVKENN